MVRRVVTGHRSGKAVFLRDGAPPRTQVFKKTPGMETGYLWTTPAEPQILQDDAADAVHENTTILPQLGETRFIYLRVAPASVAMAADYDAAGAGEEFMRLQPEMTALMEPDNPGMHRTETVDYIIVLDGEIHLELDDQKEVLLKPHDIVIQNGVRHAWRNRSDRPALLAVVLIGAQRRGRKKFWGR